VTVTAKRQTVFRVVDSWSFLCYVVREDIGVFFEKNLVKLGFRGDLRPLGLYV